MKTALIIEDDEHCRTPVAERLRRGGWEVVEAENGEQGLELAIKHCPSLIICALLMPHGNGFQLCRAVRQHLDLRHTRIVAVSSLDYSADQSAALEAGADECVAKGVLLERLNEVVSLVTAGLQTNGKASDLPSRPKHSDGPTRVRFWGVRGSIPSPGPDTVRYGGNTSCVEVRSDGEIIVLDAGTGIRPLGLALAQEFKGTSLALTVLISHTHWDHIQGFPFFLPAYNPDNRLRILGYEGAREGLAATLAGQMESPYFPIALKEMPGNIVIEELREMEFKVGAIRVEACFSKHPGVCVGYRLNTLSGSLAYVPDNEWSPADSADECSAECSQNAKMLRFIEGVDVLVIDAQYDRQEYQTHKGWGHGCVDDVVRLAISSKVKQLFLFHHDPAHDDETIASLVKHARALVRADGSELQVDAAREGDEIILGEKLVTR